MTVGTLMVDPLHADHNIEWKTSRQIHVVWEAADKHSSNIKARFFFWNEILSGVWKEVIAKRQT